MITTTKPNFVILENIVEPIHKRSGESGLAAVEHIIADRAQKGWELRESCGDELGIPVLIFQKLPIEHATPEYVVEEVWHFKGEDDIQAVTSRLWQMLDDGWLPASILHSPFTRPVVILKKSDTIPTETRIKSVVVPIEVFENTATSIIYELLDQQVHFNFTLACVMSGGLNPVLILVSKTTPKPFEYLIEHTKGSVFRSQSIKLYELINKRTQEGWQVCGAFEDSFLWPCVIFRRPTNEMPVVPLEVGTSMQGS